MEQTTRSHRQAASGDGRTMVCGLALLLMAAAAPQALAQTSMGERIQLNGTAARNTPSSSLRVTQSMVEPLATAGPLAPQDPLRADRTNSARQTMLWAEHARSGLGVGIGVEQRQAYGPAAAGLSGSGSQPQMEGGVLVGASLATGPRSHLIVQTPLQSSSANPRSQLADDPQFSQDQQRQVRVGLVFNSKKPLADFKKGFQMELSGQSTLAVKPRGGKIGVAFQRVW
ncbi:hypothetical protein SNE35_12850 [Paucibacter sp. R3-3]|uniref:Autotransporter domain-containing protein n=1 Tax=Roseateles agri TaxID=3098619 RepID=A0ABU5DGI8_9BURK|nr:hypothetical protein [Paucibacter sp. R3-3]MDY0745403.1 hypothetical protein [Paucibacter sp. R3-3]